MEYELTADGQIQADFANRAGQVLLHYEQLTAKLPKEERFEATLCVALLQAMLTQAAELLNDKSKATHPELTEVAKRSMGMNPPLFGIDSSCVVKEWRSTRVLRYREVIECLRNSLSHPLRQIEGRYPVTGYTTWTTKSKVIDGFSFIQSPFVSRNASDLKPNYVAKPHESSKMDGLRKTLNYWSSNYQVQGLEICALPSGSFAIFQDGELFVPVLQIDVSILHLRTFTLALSDLLSSSLAKSRTLEANESFARPWP